MINVMIFMLIQKINLVDNVVQHVDIIKKVVIDIVKLIVVLVMIVIIIIFRIN